MNEFELIRRLTQSLPADASVRAGVGEDCAVLEMGWPDRYLLFKTDAVVEGVHFTPETRPEQIGHKALGRCLSDIASMAGRPSHAVVTLGLPPRHDVARVEAVYQGMRTLADRYQVSIVGGETTVNPGGLFLSLAVLGTAAKDRCLLRSGALPDDALFVTGELGGAMGGKHLDFEPRLREAQWLAESFPVHAMIDLSDGLAGDLPHLLRASGVGAELHASSIPVSRAARQPVNRPPRGSAKTPLEAALTDGEDFELLFAVASAQAVPLADAWRKQFPGLRLSCIGKITAEPGVRVRDRRGTTPLTVHGYTHFEQP